MTREQIIKALQRTAAKLGRTPSRAELEVTGKVTRTKLETHFRSFNAAVREAGLEPRERAKHVDTWVLLKDWARVARRYGRIPTYTEYRRYGRHGADTVSARFGRWSKVGLHFRQHVEQTGRREEFADVLEMAKRYVIPAAVNGAQHRQRRLKTRFDLELCSAKPTADGRQQTAKELLSQMASQSTPPIASQIAFEIPGQIALPVASEIPPQVAAPAVLPPELQGKKCVTGDMLAILFAIARKKPTASGTERDRFFAIQPFPNRAVMGAPMNLGPLAAEPVNEMGVMCLFVALAQRMGFIIDVVRAQFPDCEARVEVEPGRWQRVRIEFEFESVSFRYHRHDPEGCDMIVCWRHNWQGCPQGLLVVELSKLVGRLTEQSHHGGTETRREIEGSFKTYRG